MELDSQFAISMLDKGYLDSNACAPLVKEIKGLLGKCSLSDWKHIFIEANTVTDSFAKKGLSLLMNMRIYDGLPSFCIVPYMFDTCNTLYSRV